MMLLTFLSSLYVICSQWKIFRTKLANVFISTQQSFSIQVLSMIFHMVYLEFIISHCWHCPNIVLWLLSTRQDIHGRWKFAKRIFRRRRRKDITPDFGTQKDVQRTLTWSHRSFSPFNVTFEGHVLWTTLSNV